MGELLTRGLLARPRSIQEFSFSPRLRPEPGEPFLRGDRDRGVLVLRERLERGPRALGRHEGENPRGRPSRAGVRRSAEEPGELELALAAELLELALGTGATGRVL